MGSVLEPRRPPKTDKAAILSDAIRIVTQLRSEAQKLRESNEEIQERIKELKVRLLTLVSFFIFYKGLLHTNHTYISISFYFLLDLTDRGFY